MSVSQYSKSLGPASWRLPRASAFHRLRLVVALLLLMSSAALAQPPANFAVEDVLQGLEQPIAIRFFPDGRMLLVHKKGPIQIVDVLADPVQSAAYINLNNAAHGLNSGQERGVLDLAIDPNFPAEPYIYLFYTPLSGPSGAKSRIARFTHQQNSGGVTSRGNLVSEVILWQDTQGYDSCCHYGGGLDFGPDGNLWLTTGDHFQGSYATSLQHAGGKVHRITKTGAIPAGNPYADGAGPKVDSVFAYGLRNPFRARWDLATGRFLIAEVGGNTQSIAWEDLHVIRYDAVSGRFVDQDYGTAQDNLQYDGINFGWPTVEGAPPHTDFPGATIDSVAGEPIFAYHHNGATAAINGGVVYRGRQLPAEYVGAYFYADSTRDFIRYLKFNQDGSVAPNPNPAPISPQHPDAVSYPFDLAPVGRIVSLDVGPDGALYYVSFTDSGGAYGQPNPSVFGAVRRYVYDGGNARPTVTQFTAIPDEGTSPLLVTFDITATDAELDAMTYRVVFGDGSSTAATPLPDGTPVVVQHTYAADGLYQAQLEVSDPSHTSIASKTIRVGTAPVITSLVSQNSRPGASSQMFRFGDTITFSASAADAEDGPLSGSSFSWSIAFVRPGNTHPAFGPEAGATSVDFPIPDQGQGFSGPVYYRAFLTVTDSSGLSTSSSVDIFPEKSNISFDTVPTGIVVQVNGNTATPAPFVLDTLINYDHVITVPFVVCVGGTEHQFTAWSNGPTTPQQVYNVPPTDSALTATYTAAGPCSGPPTDGLAMHLKVDTGLVLNGTNVVRWEDQSASGNTLNAVGNPTLLSGAVNGLNVVHFDGVDDAMSRSSFTGLPIGSAARSVFMVARFNAANSTTGGWAGFGYGNASSNKAFTLALTPLGMLGVQGWGTGNDFVSSPPTNGVGEWLVHGAIYGAGSLTQFKNGLPVGSASHTFDTGATGIRLGEELNGSKNLNMDVAEALVYNRALTVAELQQIGNYFAARYGINMGGSGNAAPIVSITSPANGTSMESTAMPLTLTGTATDAEDGNIASSLTWTSSRDGALGGGASIAATLSSGTHVVTATATDAALVQGSATITVTVTSATSNTAPVVIITAPVNGTSVASTAMPLTLMGTATDAEDGNVAGSLTWTSSLDGALGAGPSLAVSLSVGSHVITARATDAGLLQGSATITLTVTTSGVGSGTLITSGLVVQLEADLNVALQTGTTVAGWLDQSGLGNDLVASGNPQLVAGATPTGLPAVSFDGAGDKLERVHATAALGGLPVGNANRTIFLVAKYDASTAWGGVAYGTGATNQAFGLIVKHPTGELALQGWGSGNDRVSATAGIGAGWLVQSAVLYNGTATLFKNGAPITQWVHTYNTTLSKLVIGEEIKQKGFLDMDVAAVLVYDRALDASEHASVQAYLRNKYVVASGGNAAPVVTITAPQNGTSFASTAMPVTFSATATDAEDGDVAASLVWTSSLDGNLGTGPSVAAALSVGTHTVTAVATDAMLVQGSANITVTVTSATTNTAPVVSITAPANGTSVESAAMPLTLTGTATDAEDGDVAASLTWTSSRDGALGTGASLAVSLSVGSHVITATATDAALLQGTATITVAVTTSGSGGTGTLITSGLVVQLESDLNVALQTGTTVAGWLDQSGLGNDLVASGNPQLVAGATPTGLPAISFDGVGDKLERVHATAALGGLPVGNANRTIFLVAKYDASTVWGGVAYGTGATNQTFGLVVKHTTNELALQGWGSGNDRVSATAGIGAGWLVQSAVLDNGTATLFKNGSAITQWVHTYNTTLTKLVIAEEINRKGFLDMDVAAVLVYGRALDPSERASVEGYLRAKYIGQSP